MHLLILLVYNVLVSFYSDWKISDFSLSLNGKIIIGGKVNMAVTKERKAELVKEYGKSEKDTGAT